MRDVPLQTRNAVASPRARFPSGLTIRWTALAALLVAEGILLSLRFDTDSLRRAGEPAWADWLWRAKFALPPLGIATVTAAVAFGGDRLRAELGALARARRAGERTWPFLVAHLAAFALLARLTAFVLEGGFAASRAQGWWIAAWLATACATVALWIATGMAPSALALLARRTRSVLAAGVAVGLAAWSAGLVTQRWWDPLHAATFRLVHALVRLMAADAVLQPEDFTVGTERFAVQVLKPCAGYEGIGLISVFLGAYLLVCRRTLRFPRALVLLPLGTAAIWLANVLRLTALIAIGTWISPDVAMGGFHSYSGSLLFACVALSLVYVARTSAWLQRGDTIAATSAGGGAAAFLGPFLAVLATTMLTGAVSPDGFDRLYAARVVAALAVLWICRHAYRDLGWPGSSQAVAIGVATFVLWMALEPTAAGDAGDGLRGGLASLPPAWAALWVGVRVLGSVVTVPLAEELAFRGWLLRRLVDADFERVGFRHFTWLSFLGSSLLFGAMHDRLLAGTLAGMAYALAVHRRGRLADAVVAHATTNALIAAEVLLGGRWSLWS